MIEEKWEALAFWASQDAWGPEILTAARELALEAAQIGHRATCEGCAKGDCGYWKLLAEWFNDKLGVAPS